MAGMVMVGVGGLGYLTSGSANEAYFLDSAANVIPKALRKCRLVIM